MNEICVFRSEIAIPICHVPMPRLIFVFSYPLRLISFQWLLIVNRHFYVFIYAYIHIKWTSTSAHARIEQWTKIPLIFSTLKFSSFVRICPQVSMAYIFRGRLTTWHVNERRPFSLRFLHSSVCWKNPNIDAGHAATMIFNVDCIGKGAE